MIFKRFIRKKQTIIYLLILAFISIIMSSFISYIDYITDLINNYFRDNSYSVMITNQKKEELLNKYDSIETINNDYIILEPNEEKNNPFSKRGFVLEGENGLIDYRDSDDKISWDNFESLGKLLVTFDKNLDNNQIILCTPYELEEFKVDKIIGENLFLKIENNNYTFDIKNIVKYNFPELRISYEKFKEIKSKYKLSNVYRITFNNENNINNFYDQENENNKNLFIDVYIINNSQYDNYRVILDYFENWKYIIYFVIFIIVYTIISNLLNDEKKDIILDYVLGFSKLKIKLNLIINGLIIILFIFLLCVFFAYVLTALLYYYQLFEIKIKYILIICSLYILIYLIKINLSKLKK